MKKFSEELKVIEKRKTNWIGHILRRERLLKGTLEEHPKRAKRGRKCWMTLNIKGTAA